MLKVYRYLLYLSEKQVKTLIVFEENSEEADKVAQEYTKSLKMGFSVYRPLRGHEYEIKKGGHILS